MLWSMWQAYVCVWLCVVVTTYSVSVIDFEDSVMDVGNRRTEIDSVMDFVKAMTRRDSMIDVGNAMMGKNSVMDGGNAMTGRDSLMDFGDAMTRRNSLMDFGSASTGEDSLIDVSNAMTRRDSLMDFSSASTGEDSLIDVGNEMTRRDSVMGVGNALTRRDSMVGVGNARTGKDSVMNAGSTNARRDTTWCEPSLDIQLIYRGMNRLTRGFNDYGMRTCPSSLGDVSNNPRDPIWQRSICPWYYTVRLLGDQYYPRQVSEAVCACRDCVGNDLNQCEPVQSTIGVLRTHCENGVLQYEPVNIEITVGCTCTKPRTG
ncbi:uncharacterized protein LOC124151871 [Haliotis rufescens]|uniref:uncharacterized protein LOC124151871 n=1 Tax=Haliotis rufescens TaxID=6454 RepID=UPI001EAFB5FC|nr:uncharacterized protein LOC124151871 [Haliotis rufescens]